MIFYAIILTTICATRSHFVDTSLATEEFEAMSYMRHLNARAAIWYKRSTIADWRYATNITDYNLKTRISVGAAIAKERKEAWLKTNKFHWKTFRNPDLRRQFKLHSVLGTFALPTEKFEKFTKIVGDMERAYATARVCDYNNSSKCDLALDPDIRNIFASSRDPKELKHIWVEWRNSIGPKLKDMYEEYVNLSNEAAILNNFADNTEFWLQDFESDDIRDQLRNLWEQVKPLYLQIHAYVRHKLRKKYGDLISERGPIPAHLLGNIWSQNWNNIADFTLPYPDISNSVVTEEMIKQGYTPRKVFRIANDFFVSLNLTAMPESFWENSILEKPKDGRQLLCHPTAYDVFDKNVRIVQCTLMTEEHFYIAHHEMGHIEYFLQYSNQPVPYREGANSGFHEAVGDTIALSVTSAKHLQKIGLLNDTSVDNRTLLNKLYKTGMDKIVFLPYSYMLDLWRWDVFSNKIGKEEWNCKYWEMRYDYQGVEPPIDRTGDDFDPVAKYHVIADISFIRYFVALIVQFQFHRALCIKAGEYVPNDSNKPLHNCDIYNNTDAGNLLGQMLQMGSSKPWPDVMEVITGQRNMDASGLLDYFKPLQIWLEEENKKNGVFIGWEPTQKVCSSSKKKDKESTLQVKNNR